MTNIRKPICFLRHLHVGDRIELWDNDERRTPGHVEGICHRGGDPVVTVGTADQIHHLTCASVVEGISKPDHDSSPCTVVEPWDEQQAIQDKKNDLTEMVGNYKQEIARQDGIVAVLEADLETAIEENVKYQQDHMAAATEFRVALPEPGTDAAKLMLDARSARRQASEMEKANMKLLADVDQLRLILADLSSEINCRWAHGADGKEHLQYVEKKLTNVLHFIDDMRGES